MCFIVLSSSSFLSPSVVLEMLLSPESMRLLFDDVTVTVGGAGGEMEAGTEIAPESFKIGMLKKCLSK